MKTNKSLLFIFPLTALVLTGCVQPNSSSKKKTDVSSSSSQTISSQQVIEDDTVPVFVLSGQSNMEGSTYFVHPDGTPLLKNYFEEEGMDYDPVENGIPNVLTSYYGYYYPNGWANAHSSSEDKSSPEAMLTPNFAPTKVGMGVGDNVQGKTDIFFGPELGIANTISEYADEDNPVHLIKCAFSGSGFEKTDGANWKTRPDDSLTDEQNASKSLYYLLRRYVDNCLNAILEEGKTPVIKGFIWHQGESDTGNRNYQTQMEALIKDFRDDYAEYAEDEDGQNIAFLDCTIYDGSKNRYGSQSDVNNGINKLKNNIAAKGQLDKDDENYEKNYIVDGTFTDHGLKLEIGDDAQGGFNMYHYNTKDAYILGQAYGQIIIDNDLL